MRLFEKLKGVVVGQTYQYTYECADCGSTFETNQEPGSYWLACRACDAEDLELVE